MLKILTHSLSPLCKPSAARVDRHTRQSQHSSLISKATGGCRFESCSCRKIYLSFLKIHVLAEHYFKVTKIKIRILHCIFKKFLICAKLENKDWDFRNKTDMSLLNLN